MHPGDTRKDFAIDIVERVADDPTTILPRVVFSDEATFHVSGKVNCRMWGSRKPYRPMLCESICDSPKLNVWCDLFHDRDIGPFFLEHSMTGTVLLGMIENFVMRQIEDLNEDVIFITTVHHHWSCNV